MVQYQVQHDRIIEDTHNELEQQYGVILGIIESPSVIIIIDTFSKFTEMVDEIEPDIVYRYSDSFYVFDKGYTRAWKYTPLIENVNSNLLFPKWERSN